VPGAIVGFTILGAADESSPLVRRYPVVAGVHAALQGNVVNDPTPDGLYGYKLLLPKGPINGLQISIAEVTATIHGLTIPQGTCLRRGAGGRCTARARTDTDSFVLPRCPPSGRMLAQPVSTGRAAMDEALFIGVMSSCDAACDHAIRGAEPRRLPR
jgi:hypothetical protein